MGLIWPNSDNRTSKMSNTISIMDQPFFPVKPQASKRGMLIIVAFIAVLFAILTTIVVKEYLDDSIKYPARAEEITGLPIAGAIPDKNQRDKSIMMGLVENTLLEQSVSTINLELMKNGGFKEQYVSILYSIRPNEGKSLYAEKLVKKLAQINGKVLYLRPILRNETQHFPSFMEDKIKFYQYEVKPSFVESSSWKDLVNEDTDNWEKDYKFVFVELPPINRKSIPAGLVSTADFALLLINANRVWRSVDMHLNSLFLKAMNGFTMVVLNKVQVDYLENLLGEIPKSRTKVRRWIKKAILFNFRKH